MQSQLSSEVSACKRHCTECEFSAVGPVEPAPRSNFSPSLQETAQFQNRLNRAMVDCQDQARDMIKPGMDDDPQGLAKVEEEMLKCMSKVVDSHIKLLNPMKERIVGELKKLS